MLATHYLKLNTLQESYRSRECIRVTCEELHCPRHPTCRTEQDASLIQFKRSVYPRNMQSATIQETTDVRGTDRDPQNSGRIHTRMLFSCVYG
jgi:hypothetical protein